MQFTPSAAKEITKIMIRDGLSPETHAVRMGTKMASGIGWDGYNFWVGEYKFSNRLLGFAPSK